MSTAKNIITSVFAGSVAGIVSSFFIKRSAKDRPDKKGIYTKNTSSNIKDVNDDNHFFV